MSISAIVPAFNEEASISKTLRSLLSQTKRLSNIIVVDDGSTDRTGEAANSVGNVYVLRNPKQMGKAKSINRALGLISTDLVMIVDADTVLAESYAAKAVDAFADMDVAAGSGFVAPAVRSSNAAIKNSRVVEDFYAQSTLKKGQNLVNGLFVISGCCAVFRTSVLKRFGFPSDTVTEDLDLTWLLQQEGYRTSLVESYAYTLEPNSLKDYTVQVRRWYMGFLQCLSKYGSKIFLSKSLTFTLALILVESLLFTLFWGAVIGLIFVFPWLSGELNYLRWLVLTLLAVDIVIVCFPAMLKANDAGYLKHFLYGLPAYYSLRVANTFIWWSTFVEWLFGRRVIWVKT